jgi:hypothetical protein
LYLLLSRYVVTIFSFTLREGKIQWFLSLIRNMYLDCAC